MEKIKRTIETKKATVVVTNTATLKTTAKDFVVSGSCKNYKQILKAVEKQLGENEIAVSIKEVVTEANKNELPLDQFVKLAPVAFSEDFSIILPSHVCDTVTDMIKDEELIEEIMFVNFVHSLMTICDML